MSTTCPASDLLLDRTAYLVRARYDAARAVDTYDILDPLTESKLGFASEAKPTPAGNLVRSAFGRNLLLTAVEGFEADGQTLVFSVRELPSVWSPHLVVSDAEDHPLCYFTGIFASIGGGFFIQDRQGQLLGRLEADINEGRYPVLGRGERPIGFIAETRSDGPPPVIEYRVATAHPEERSRVARLLLLASSIALDIVYRDRAGSA